MPSAVHDGSKWAGKQSKDSKISLFLATRNIFESSSIRPELELIVHRDATRANNYKIVLSLLARMVIDGGLQFVETTVYQEESMLQQSEDGERFEVVQEMDDGYFRVRMKMPAGLPDSLTLTPLTSGRMALGYGLTWYVAASLVPSDVTSLDYLHGKRHSKVVIAFSKVSLLPSPSNLGPAVVQAGNSAQLQVTARLEKSCYVLGEDKSMKLSLDYVNPQQLKVKGIRINCKQLITLHTGTDSSPLRIKNTWLQYDSELPEVLVELPLTGLQSQVAQAGGCYQLALLPRFPRASMQWELVPSANYDQCRNHALRRGLKSIQVQYYLNVHVVLSWSRRNLILKVPFQIVLSQPPYDSPHQAPPSSSILTSPTINPEVNRSVHDRLPREEDLRAAVNLLKHNSALVERAQLVPISCTRADEGKMIANAKEMTQSLAQARISLIHLMQQHANTTSARDLCTHLTKALELHAQVLFYSDYGASRSNRERVMREARESLNALELLLRAQLKTTTEEAEEMLMMEEDEQVTGVLIRASNELQQSFMHFCNVVPALKDALNNQQCALDNLNKLLNEEGMGLLDNARQINPWVMREILEESGWCLGFLPPINYPSTIKLALQQAHTLHDRIAILNLDDDEDKR